eukprot:CAMPEP_0181299194 /NCGR_PEP_ID=MMETSP1101-20121128/6208_1 /TAXON_ID=46948 /ORGANISM="Rhodomonas abbreviata, Strain Caron Lab Isolate" /LENGTH=97 /DNA_ID=CAMNT_0023404311 /DNA_START=109 /DNA_END=402 /DNA_ORIENTATION=-
MSVRMIPQYTPVDVVRHRLAPIATSRHTLSMIGQEGRKLAAHNPAGLALVSAGVFTAGCLLAVKSMEKVGLVAVVKTTSVAKFRDLEGFPASRHVHD